MTSGPRNLMPCGTRAAYKRHKRRGEPACEACKRAESVPWRYRTTELQPCGTPAAYKRHLRRGERACAECLEANRRRSAEAQDHQALHFSSDRPLLPNGLPETPPYRWRARRYAWAVRVLAASEAKFGKPEEEAA